MSLLSHFSQKSLLSRSLRPPLISSLRASKFSLYPSSFLYSQLHPLSQQPSLACHVTNPPSSRSVSMDSSSPEPTVSIDSLSDDFKNQNLGADGGLHDKNSTSKGKLTLADLNWDHSFVRELPGDSRTDTIPRQVLVSWFVSLIVVFLNFSYLDM